MKKQTILLILTLLLCFNACKSSEDYYSDEIDSLDGFITNIQENDRFNGAVLLAKGDDVVFMDTYGYTDYTRTKELTLQSSFRLASVSKQFTGAAIMILKDKELLDFDDDITLYLPELHYEGITIRHLLNHTSGITNYTKREFFENYGQYFIDKKIITNNDLLSFFIDNELQLDFDPGSMYTYSNTGYVFLSLIVSRISGLTFETFLKKEIFDPLEMKNSSEITLESKENVLPNRTWGFIGNVDNSYSPANGLSGDGAVFLSIEDFLLWAKALRENNLFSESTWKEAITPAILNSGEKSYYGFGWFLSSDGSSIFHTGGWLSAQTSFNLNLINGGLLVILDSASVGDTELFAKMRTLYLTQFE